MLENNGKESNESNECFLLRSFTFKILGDIKSIENSQYLILLADISSTISSRIILKQSAFI